jgi:hypothetical protein
MKIKNKSVKKFIKVGSIIQTFATPVSVRFYNVTELKEKTFCCQECNDDRFDIQQKYEFYYNIPMRVLNISASNLSMDVTPPDWL